MGPHMAISLGNKLRGSIKDMLRTGSGVCEDAAVAMEDALRELERLQSAAAPSPRSEDVCVSLGTAPDYAPDQFMGGVVSIAHRGGVLIFYFAHGGEIHVSNPVVYMAPDTH